MELVIQLIPVRLGTSEPVGEKIFVPCPTDVEPDTVLSFLTQQFGEPIEIAWTYTVRHPRVELGWIFPGAALANMGRDVVPDSEALAIPMIVGLNDTMTPMFEMQADQRLEFEALAASGRLDGLETVTAPPRDYAPDQQSSQPADRADSASP